MAVEISPTTIKMVFLACIISNKVSTEIYRVAFKQTSHFVPQARDEVLANRRSEETGSQSKRAGIVAVVSM